VLGVVFGAAIDDPDVGFALTLKEVRPVLAAASGADGVVGTGGCTRE
jgi:hypothetical protein